MLNVKQTNSIKRMASENGFRDYTYSVNPATNKGDNYMGNIFLKDISLPHPSRVFTTIHDYSLDNLEEYLIFDDMKSLGYRMQDRKKTMDEAHVRMVIKELAKLHSFSFVLKHLKPEMYKEFSIKLNDYLKVLLRTSKTDNRIKHLMKRYAKNSEFVKIMETYQNSSSQIFDNDGENWDLVIIHGDVWCNNLMFKYDDAENPQKPTSCCFLDWQLTKIGSPAYDLCYFFFYATSKEILNNHKEYLALYYEIMRENLRYIGSDLNDIFPFELLEKHWRTFCRFMFLNTVTNLDMVLNDEKTLLEILEDKNDTMSNDIQHCETYYERISDEEFHIPLGQQYCRFKFDEWDPKVTTLPGLYLITSLLLGPLNLCSIYWLRFISLLFSCLNIILLYAIFSLHLKKEWQNILSAITVVLLPPLYFFSHIYYTDIVSLTSILLLIFLNELGFHYFAAIAGFFSILCRQTNVIFLAVYAGKYILNELYAIWVNKNFKYKKFGELPAKHFQTFFVGIIKNPIKLLKHMPLQFWLNTLSYISVLLAFLIFVLLNGSIVVGDKSAHQVSVNIPQIFYFGLFSLIFGWPYFIIECLNFLQFARRHKLFIISILWKILVV
ncbi:hypothetical protein GWI33_006642 [Rhynchophorus ferrugineus]|uniref:Dol-P-Glc:Glc(2)Man(9)GlcNAc(2)-PP-Dol alpha-1,2-glucosyltransferase n=1 Tax=Rhynchophorus ferrugineus TaxID=354439 RepID=A0A834MCS9_RHYFE|nr:hypothetical protein GWI33_006642 [Rhynchophorus ferrugineus]